MKSILYIVLLWFSVVAIVSIAYVQGDTLSGQRDFEKFKHEIYREIRAMKTTEQELKNEIRSRDNYIRRLENRMTQLEEKCGKQQTTSVAKQRRQIELHVAFTAYKDTGIHNISYSQPIIYNQVLLNDGKAYNPATGFFTAPVSGVYLFSYSIGAKVIPNVHLSQYDVFTRLVIDGVHQVSAVAESTDPYDDEQGSSTAILYVDEGSQVWTIHELKGGNNLYSDNSERITSFTGILLYPKDPDGVSTDLGIVG